MSDRKIIYLDDALDALRDEFKKAPTTAIRAMEVIRGLPPAQPKQTVDNYIESLPTSPLLVGKMPPAQQENDWTPVSKKKHPDKEGEYLVTDDAGGMAEVDKDVFMFLDDGTPCWLYSQNVTAWRELPEPYKERREDGNQ